MVNISNSDNVIDSRDIIERIEEIESYLEDISENDDKEYIEALEDELKILRELEKEASDSPDWQYGEMLIRYSYFKEYAQELAEDCGMISGTEKWPLNCIDWNEAAEELSNDYFTVDFDGIEYFIRS